MAPFDELYSQKKVTKMPSEYDAEDGYGQKTDSTKNLPTILREYIQNTFSMD